MNELSANGDTSYNADATPNHRDSYSMDPYVGPSTILALQASGDVRKTEAGDRSVKLSTRIGGTDYDSDARVVRDAYQFEHFCWETKPSDSTPWLTAELNAAEFGLKIES